MITPENIRTDIAKLDALLEAFERSFLHLVDLGEDNVQEREKGTMAFYAIRDLTTKIMSEMDELKGHMEVCNAIAAVNFTKKEGEEK